MNDPDNGGMVDDGSAVGEAYAPTSPEPQIEDAAEVFSSESGEEPDEAVVAPVEEGEEAGDDERWFDNVEGFDNDMVQFLDNGGYESPEQALKSFRELSGLYGDQSGEVGQLRQRTAYLEGQLANLVQPGQQEQAPPSIAENLPMIQQQLMSQVEMGEITQEQFVARLNHANQLANEERLESQRSEILEQVRNEYGPALQNADQLRLRTEWRDQAAELKRKLGPDQYETLAPYARQVINERASNDPQFRNSETAVKQAFAEASVMHLERQRAQADAQVTTQGAARQPQAVDPAEAIVAEIDAIGGSEDMSGGFL